MNFALIVCDEPVPVLVEKHGDYPKFFKEMFSRASKDLEGELEIKWKVYDTFRKLEIPLKVQEYDAIVISGSRWSVNDSNPWIILLIEWVRKTWYFEKSKVPLFAICFGHQIVIKSFGQSVGPSLEWELGWTNLSLSSAGMELFGVNDSITIHSIHKEEALSIPEGFENLASSDKCQVQALICTKSDQCIVTIQGHPEVSSQYIFDLAEIRKSIIPEKVYNHARETVDLPTDGNLVAKSFLALVLQSNRCTRKKDEP